MNEIRVALPAEMHADDVDELLDHINDVASGWGLQAHLAFPPHN